MKVNPPFWMILKRQVEFKRVTQFSLSGSLRRSRASGGSRWTSSGAGWRKERMTRFPSTMEQVGRSRHCAVKMNQLFSLTALGQKYFS